MEVHQLRFIEALVPTPDHFASVDGSRAARRGCQPYE